MDEQKNQGMMSIIINISKRRLPGQRINNDYHLSLYSDQIVKISEYMNEMIN